MHRAQCLFSGLSVTAADWAIFCPLYSSPPHKASIIWKYQQRLYSAISPWLSDLSCPPPPVGASLSPLDPSHGNKLGSQVGLLFWRPSEKPKWNIQLQSRRHFSPLFLNPGLLFPWESQGLIWSSSVAAAAATVLKAKSVCVRERERERERVCVCVCVYSGYSSQQGSSSGGTQLVALQRSNPPPRTLWPPEPCQ